MELEKLALAGSAISLAIGGYMLYGVVPLFLTVGTALEVALLLLSLALFDRKPFRYLALVLNFLLLATLFDPAHVSAYERFGTDAWITALDVLSFLAFGVFPLMFLIVYFSKRKSNQRTL
ncbi:MAG: hypothetical protein JHC23_04230 [Sulfolobus sp.]|nr:hypothetical protein [Sulfolobus sp.]